MRMTRAEHPAQRNRARGSYPSGAPDVLKNSSPVTDSDLLPGDLFVGFNGGHIQLVTGSRTTWARLFRMLFMNNVAESGCISVSTETTEIWMPMSGGR